jgi:hypothetical protein
VELNGRKRRRSAPVRKQWEGVFLYTSSVYPDILETGEVPSVIETAYTRYR